MKKNLLVLLMALLVGSWLAAQDVKLTMIYAGGDPLSKEMIHNVVSDFTAANPNVQITEFPSVGGGSYLDFIKVKDAVGEFPDLVEMRDTPLFYRAGKLAVLPDDVTKLVVNPVKFGGKVYTVSLTAQAPLGMIYNAKFFKDNKLSEPKTYAEFTKLLADIKAKKVTPIVVGGKDLWHLGFTFSNYYLHDIALKNPNFIAERYAGKVKFTDANFVKFLGDWSAIYDMKKAWVDPGFTSTADNQTAAILTSGKAVMLYSGTWMLQQIKDADPSFEIGWFPIPSPVDNKFNLIGGSTAQGWAMSAEAAKDPAKAKAITDFMKFFFKKETYLKYIAPLNGIPSTVEKMPYKPTVAVMEEILDLYADTPASQKQLMWNQNVGDNELPPGFRDYTYKASVDMLLGGKKPADIAKMLDTQWEVATKDFNPVLKK